MKDPAKDLATHLAGAVASLTLGENIFHSGERPSNDHIPDLAVFVYSTGGFSTPYAGTDEGEHIADLQVMVRGEPDQHEACRQLALAVRDALRFQTVAGYIELALYRGEPAFAGVDEKMRPAWTLSPEMIYQE